MVTIFRNAMLVQFNPANVQLGELRVDGNTITAVGESVDLTGARELIDCRGAVVMPGLVNGHTHLYSALAAGMPGPSSPPRDFHEILKYVWWRLDRAHDLESVRTSGQVGGMAALRCGTTTLIDHHASPNAIDGSLDQLRAGLAETGCRGVLCYETTDRNGDGESVAGLAENERFIHQCQAEAAGQFAGMVGAHASFTLSAAALEGCVDLARRLGVGVHIHVAEDPVDQRLTEQQFGHGLMERFRRAGLLDVAGTLLAHGTHLSSRDIAMVNERASTISMAHNPNSNMNNAVGYAPVADFARSALLGTDGIGADMWREARTALFKSHDAHRSVGDARVLELLDGSARFASQCLGVTLGQLVEGAEADLVVTNYRPHTPLRSDNLTGHVVYAMGPEYVRDVMIAGHWCLRGGDIVSCDAISIANQSREVASRLHEAMAGIRC